MASFGVITLPARPLPHFPQRINGRSPRRFCQPLRHCVDRARCCSLWESERNAVPDMWIAACRHIGGGQRRTVAELHVRADLERVGLFVIRRFRNRGAEIADEMGGIRRVLLAATAGPAAVIAPSQAASKADRMFAASLGCCSSRYWPRPIFADRWHPSLHHRTSLLAAKWPGPPRAAPAVRLTTPPPTLRVHRNTVGRKNRCGQLSSTKLTNP
jgi:hypothetical protein